MRLGIDLDGVCYDFVEDARHVVAEWLRVHPTELPDAKVWDFFESQWGVPNDTFWRIWFEDVDRGRAWAKRPPVDGCIEGLQALRDAGHSVHIVTSRKGGELATASWVKEYDIPYDTLTIGRDKTVVNIEVLLDDWERNWREVTAAGGRCVVFNRPWNEHVDEAERVHSWDEFVSLVGAR